MHRARTLVPRRVDLDESREESRENGDHRSVVHDRSPSLLVVIVRQTETGRKRPDGRKKERKGSDVTAKTRIA